MHVLNTAGVDFAALLTAIRDFLVASGWTVGTDNIAGGTLVMTNSGGRKYRIARTSTARNDFYSGNFNDIAANLSYDLGNIGGAAGTFSATTACNDLAGPYPNIWLITDDAATYCHVIVQCAPVRYAHFSFGDLDDKGIHATPLPFCSALFWQFWSNSAQFADNNGGGNPFNYVVSGSHDIDFTDGTSVVGIPAGLLDTTLFFTAGAIPNSSLLSLCDREYAKTAGTNNSARFLDYFPSISNKAHIGGIMLSPMPVVSTAGTNDVRAFIGEYPGVALVNMQGLSPGQTLTFADDDWIVFPWKQFGTAEAMKYGLNPLPQPNSWRYGFAYRVTN
ncbi:hypothetical protein [Sphingomonas phage Birtae]|nr:hypothetical protein [Sphingomonas phage Birtae]